jgi:hypothetical protein
MAAEGDKILLTFEPCQTKKNSMVFTTRAITFLFKQLLSYPREAE